MGLLKEFREFALKGNVLDLAVAVIIGGAFGGIVNSLIKDIIMPVVSIPGNVDFNNLYLPLTPHTAAAIKEATEAAAKVIGGKTVHIPPTLEQARALGPVMAYGSFITILINFIILAFCIFMVVKAFNTAKKRFEHQAAAAPAAPTTDQKLLMEIRDLLAKKS